MKYANEFIITECIILVIAGISILVNMGDPHVPSFLTIAIVLNCTCGATYISARIVESLIDDMGNEAG
jgi:hypothetical protein